MKKRLHILVPLALIVTPLVVEALYINRFAVNVPFWDQWALVPLLQALFQKNTSRLFAALWNQHNEHRILFPKLVFLALSRVSGWNAIAEMYFGLFLASLSLVGLGLIYKKTCRGHLWGFVPISWLVFNLGQWENILWGWQLQIYLQVVGAILAIHFLSAKSLRSVTLAILCGVVASFSFSSGLLIWPVGSLCLAALRAEKKQLVLWSLVGVLVVVAYYKDYVPPSHHPSLTQSFSQPLTTVVFFLANVGIPLGGDDLKLSSIMGAYLIVLLLILFYKKLRAMTRVGIQMSVSDVTLSGLVLFSFLSSMVITFGRVGFGDLGLAMNSRYVTITSVGIAGIYMLFIEWSLSSGNQHDDRDRVGFTLFPALLSVLIIGLAVANLHGILVGEALRTGRLKMKYALQTFNTQPDDVLTTLYPSPQDVRERAEFLRGQRLSVFGEPVNVLLLTSSGEGMPVGEILPGRPVVQTLRCPVQTLNDVEILFATYARNNTSSFEVTLADDGEPVIQQSLSSTEIQDNSWVHIILPKPIEDCMGRDLVLRIDSQDASAGNAITVWTYPRYYEGDLQEPEEQWLANRVVGLELNAYSYGLSK